MTKALFALVLGAVCLLAVGSISADSMKWSQPPDLNPTGMDVNASPDPTGMPFLLASDFRCIQTGPITEIHVFGSWLNDQLPMGNPTAVTFRLSFHHDIPDPDGSGPGYSMPGPAIWLKEFYPQTFEVRIHAEGLLEGWYTPPQMYLPVGDHICFEYIFRLAPGEFIQEGTTTNPVIYWLDVQATPMQPGTYFGWKTAIPPHQIDDAVYFNGLDEIGVPLPWFELRYPVGHQYNPQSFDLAFQIWGPDPTGACCYPDGSCAVLTRLNCLGTQGGTYMGDGTNCDDADGDGVADLCEQFLPTGACCFHDGSCSVITAMDCTQAGGTYAGDGSNCNDANGNGVADLCEQYVTMGACCRADNTCYVTAQAICVQGGGTYLGDNTLCLGDLNGNGQDDACEFANTGACCLPNGSCTSGQNRIACTMAGGQYMGDGSACKGDGNQNGVDDLCENTPDLKWFQPPDLSPTGMDVNASPDPTGMPFLLASDFRCTQTGPITEIHVFGSWLNDQLPQGNPGAVAFRLSIHPDIPDPDGEAGPLYSMPGPAIWLKSIQPGNFEYRVLQANILEGWYSPPSVYMPIGDRVCYEYIFHLDPTEFIQHGTTTNPIIYWLDVQATPLQQGTYFGWKTAVPPHQIDDAVYFNGIDELGVPFPWQELRYPDLHLLHPQSFDLAFQIWGLEQELTGACCFDNGSCLVMTRAACTQGGGTYAGDGTVCAGDVNPPNGIDDVCESVVMLGACCYGDPFNPSCVRTTQTICTAPGGLYNGTWYANEYCFGGTFQCPTLGACCYGDPATPACINVTQSVCTGQYSGTWYAGQNCDNFECPSSPEKTKWRQVPNLTPLGMDVMATNTVVLADDFECSEPGRITKVVVYGSWWHDGIPNHSNVGFTLSFHKDLPATEQDFSRPGTLLCLQQFPPGTYQYEPVVGPGQIEEGWFDPRSGAYEFPGDHNLFKYTFVITDPCWTQTGRNGEPKVYWLNVQARVASMIETYFGWKTSTQHWNDDATWAMGSDPDISPWQELRNPPLYPGGPGSIDLAFEIYGVAGDCCLGRVGDANGSYEPTDEVTLGDIMLMVDVKFISGDCSKLPCLTEADVNQDGGSNPSCEEHVTLGDIMTLVDFLFINNTPLKDCL